MSKYKEHQLKLITARQRIICWQKNVEYDAKGTIRAITTKLMISGQFFIENQSMI